MGKPCSVSYFILGISIIILVAYMYNKYQHIQICLNYFPCIQVSLHTFLYKTNKQSI